MFKKWILQSHICYLLIFFSHIQTSEYGIPIFRYTGTKTNKSFNEQMLLNTDKMFPSTGEVLTYIVEMFRYIENKHVLYTRLQIFPYMTDIFAFCMYWKNVFTYWKDVFTHWKDVFTYWKDVFTYWKDASHIGKMSYILERCFIYWTELSHTGNSFAKNTSCR